MKGSRRNTGNFCRKSYYYSPAVRGKGAQGLFGVWDLPNGRETEGYAHLEECVRHNSDYMKKLLKEFPGACNDPRDDIEDTLSKMEQIMPKYCELRKFATEELRSLDEGSEKQNDWGSLLAELSPAVRTFIYSLAASGQLVPRGLWPWGWQVPHSRRWC